MPSKLMLRIVNATQVVLMLAAIRGALNETPLVRLQREYAFSTLVAVTVCMMLAVVALYAATYPVHRYHTGYLAGCLAVAFGLTVWATVQNYSWYNYAKSQSLLSEAVGNMAKSTAWTGVSNQLIAPICGGLLALVLMATVLAVLSVRVLGGPARGIRGYVPHLSR